jgi:hypothetical protein
VRPCRLIGDPNALGGEDAIAAAIQKCLQLDLKVALTASDSTRGTNRSNATFAAVDSDRVSAATDFTPLMLQPSSGTNPNAFTFQSARVPVNEALVGYAMNLMYQQAGCDVRQPVVNTDPNVTFKAVLTVPADLFSSASPAPTTLDVSTDGADEMDYDIKCPYVPGQHVQQITQAMKTIGYVTQQKPVRLTETAPSGSFGASFTNQFGDFSTTGTIMLKAPA